jgi:hypothetical protein
LTVWPSSTGQAEPPESPPRAAVKLPDYVTARMLNEFVYCLRLFFYEWIEGVFAYSGNTSEGALRKARESSLKIAHLPGTDFLASKSVATFKRIAFLCGCSPLLGTDYFCAASGLWSMVARS